MKEAIQLRREHLICYKQQDHQGSRLRHFNSELETRNVYLVLNNQSEDFTQKF